MNNMGLPAARCLQGKVQRVSDIACLHGRAQLPGNDIARVIIKDGPQIHPTPANNLQIGEVGLPQLVDGCCLVSKLIGSLDLAAPVCHVCDFCLIFVPCGHYDEPEILSYAIPLFCSIGADVRQF
jgi:hypothetical protein